MKAIFIDAQNETVTEVETDGIESWYNLLSCEVVESVRLNSYGDSIIVDEEGLLKKNRNFFRFGRQPFSGSGIIIGVDDEGETMEPIITLEQVKANISFIKI